MFKKQYSAFKTVTSVHFEKCIILCFRHLGSDLVGNFKFTPFVLECFFLLLFFILKVMYINGITGVKLLSITGGDGRHITPLIIR